MPKFPVISYKELIKLFTQLGYTVERQRGSHIRLKKILPAGHHSITIPAHKQIAKGTLNDILGKVSYCVNLSKEELILRLTQL